MTLVTRPHFPIIYVRGYAGSEDAVEETVATPYMGFNLGSTRIRQRWNGALDRFIFESPLVRLMKDYGYRDVYEAGDELPAGTSIEPRSLVIYRYYDQVSPSMAAEPDRPDIPVYAEGLGQLIEKLRDQVAGDDEEARAAFRVYLVAHSMGGLICRCFLQNDQVSTAETKALVDKVFTYATPHDGIDMRVIGNIPGFFSRNNANNFNRDNMRDYLGLPEDQERAHDLGGKFDEDRFFSLVGTNDRDYEVASGWSRRLIGPMSDGLVRIKNAAARGTPRAYVHRSHSGHHGIVNSEEGYQNLVRFLFGDVRVDGILKVDELELPTRVEKAWKAGKRVRASYHFEVVLRPRGARYDLHRRTTDEGSAIFRKFDEMLMPEKAGLDAPRQPFLFSTFLSARYRTKKSGALVFSIDLRALVPEYEVDGFLWLDEHIEGSHLYRDTITIAADCDSSGCWKLRYGFDSRTPGRVTRSCERIEDEGGDQVFTVPIASKSRPGMKARLELRPRRWNL